LISYFFPADIYLLGSAPPGKQDTILRRSQQQLATARLFYTTSPTSRSGPSFSRQSCILPPFASHTFIHALASLDVATRFVPLGEADGECVILADRLGGYVLGQDSDFLILVGGAGVSSRLIGYCPFDMMWWIDGASETQAPSSHGSGWHTASNSRRGPPQRLSTLLPPANLTNPQLVMTSFAPQALRQRLRLPASVLPLFASLCGNDYTPPAAAEIFFEAGLSAVPKVEKVARTLREQIFWPKSTPPKSGNAGDHAVELVTKVMRKLSIRPFVNDQALQELVDAIIEATFQYILPIGGECCKTYPFCGELDEIGCQSSSSTVKPSRAKEAYAAAQRRGLLNGITHAWLYPGRVLLWTVLEDPSGPSFKASEILRGVRRRAWEIAVEGFGGLRWPESAKAEEKEEAAGEHTKSSLPPDADLSGETTVATETSSESETLVNDDSPVQKGDSIPVPAVVPRTIIEYVRQGSSARIVPHTIELQPQEEQANPTCLQNLEVRLRAYLNPLQSDTPTILSLPVHLHPLIATIRLCILSARTDKWRRADVEAVLKAGLGCYSAWQKNSCSSKSRDTEEGSYPVLTNRHCGFIAQISATMTDAHLLAQALLLLPDSPDRPSENPGLTHLVPFVFFSGTVLHSLLSGIELESSSIWRWTDTERAAYDECLPALTEGIEEHVVGWIRPPLRPTVPTGVMPNDIEEAEDDHVGEDGQVVSGDGQVEKEKRKKKRNQRRRRGIKEVGSGRFDLLEALPAS